MSNNINLKKGLDIPMAGAPVQKTVREIAPATVSVKPSDFKGFKPRLLVKEGDTVLAGTPVMADKNNPEILVTAPASGTVEAIVRGEKRKLLEVRIKTGETMEYVDFGARNVKSLSAEQVKEALLASGLWLGLIQRPYGIIANPEVKPKAIFVSAFNTAPLAAYLEFALDGELENIQAGIDAVAKLTDGGVHVSFNEKTMAATPFNKLGNIVSHSFSGKHPAGNTGIQISHISPIMKGETVWTISMVMLAAIGKFFLTGKLDLTRQVAVTGPVAKNPSYVKTLPGVSMKELAEFYDNSANDVRFVSGDCLSGTNVGAGGSLCYHDNQVTLLHEETERELFGWVKPFRPGQFSTSRSYFSWLTPKKKYNMGTNTHGGVRAFVCSDVYGKVLPMDIFPVYLVKACLAEDIDKMEKFGIYEVLPEDLALCEYVDPSKIDIQDIIQKGIDLMIKEMA
ncbi:MAG: Na(+)-translocating NADH-quinone reductase subunit A [Bacteroidales bacterium]|nr:Na(+)-translocating NADH-quinone reductase subunit A [Bacteroidales bacterium]